MTAVPREELTRVRVIAERVAQSYGLELFDVQFRREPMGWVLRIVIDQPAPRDLAGQALQSPRDESVSVDDCRRVSEDLSAILDVENVLGDDTFGHPYTLEVSSPGLDRPLRHADDYRRFTGRLAKVVVKEAVNGQKHFAGRIKGIDDNTVVLEEGRRTHRIPLDLVTRARLDVEF